MFRRLFLLMALAAIASGCSEPAAPPTPPTLPTEGDTPDDAAPEEGASSDATPAETDEATAGDETNATTPDESTDEPALADDDMPAEPGDEGEPLDDALASDEPADEDGPATTDEEPAAPADNGADVAAALEAALPAVQAAYEQGDYAGAVDVIRKVHEQFPEDSQALLYMMNIAMTLGGQMQEDPATAEQGQSFVLEAAQHARALRENPPELPPGMESHFAEMLNGAFYQEACILAEDGKHEEAVAALRDAFESGYTALAKLDSSEQLAAVRELPEYASLLDEFRPQIEEQLREALEKVRGEIQSQISSFESFPFTFDLVGFDQQPVALANYAGQVVIVDIWATWCGPCRMEIPHFVDLKNRYESEGLAVVGINCGEDGTPEQVKEQIDAIAQETGLNYTCALGDQALMDQVPGGVQGFPTTLFLDRTGKVRLVMVGAQPLEVLEAVVTELLAEEAPAATEEPAAVEDAAAAATPDADAESTLRLVEEADAQDAAPVPGEAPAEVTAPAEEAPAEEAAETP